jgi:hypothetical protein
MKSFIEFIQEAYITDNPNFVRWFGDSAVIDASGNPLIVYHGTSKDFGEFIYTQSRGLFSFTSTPVLANAYANRENGQVLAVYLSMQTPFDFRINKDVDALMSVIEDPGTFTEEDIRDGSWGTIEPYHLELKQLGYDGIITQNEFDREAFQYHVFMPTQIKSAIGNNGDFDPFNPVITESR